MCKCNKGDKIIYRGGMNTTKLEIGNTYTVEKSIITYVGEYGAINHTVLLVGYPDHEYHSKYFKQSKVQDIDNSSTTISIDQLINMIKAYYKLGDRISSVKIDGDTISFKIQRGSS